MRLLNTGVPQIVSHKPSTGKNASELKAAVRRLTNNDKSIVDLTLAWSLVADQGCQQVSEALLHNTRLTTLDLYYNDITPMGATALARMLKVNYTLCSLNLQNNSIGDSGAEALHRAIRHENTSLTSLNISNNHVSPDLVHAINVALEDNRQGLETGVTTTAAMKATASAAAGNAEPGALTPDSTTSPSLAPKATFSSPHHRQNRRFQEAFLDAPTKRRTTQLQLNKYGCDLAR